MLRFATCLFILTTLVLSAFAMPVAAKERERVLVLTFNRPTSPVTYRWSRGIQSVLGPRLPNEIDLDIEYLDLQRFNDEQYLSLVRDLFRYQYLKAQPDLIIAVFSISLEFLLRAGEDLFPGVPVVFFDAERSFLEGQPERPNTIGVFGDETYKETLDLALSLHPDTQHLTVVAGSEVIAEGYLKTARRVFETFEDRVGISYRVGLPMKDILQEVSDLPDNALVIYLPVLSDGTGKTFEAPESLALISEASNVPVYSCWDVLFGHGMVGGYVSSFEEMGRTAAELGLRILDGERVADIPVTSETDFKYMFDWRQLKRWSISVDRLPPGSIVEFQEFTYWDQHKGGIIGALLLITLQTLVISFLVQQRRMRRRTEETLLEVQSDLAHIDRVVTVSALTSALAHEINQPLAAMRSYAQAALRCMDMDPPSYDKVRRALEGVVSDNKRAAAVVNRLRDLVKRGTIEREQLDVNSIIHEVMALINSDIVLRNASINLDLHPNLQDIYGDSVQMQQVLMNLLTNALHATEDQPRDVRKIAVKTRPENRSGVRVSISDLGDGIPPDKVEEVFAPFHTTKAKGLGLGLSICRTIIEAHGGRIWAENNPNGGATFLFTLPVGEQNEGD